MKLSIEFNKSDLTALDKDLDRLLSGIGNEIASAPKMKPMVDKIRTGMTENEMRFSNNEIWKHNKEVAKNLGIIDFDSPLMVTGQLVNDFIFYAGKPKTSTIPYSDEFILGYFTWAAKERRRPTVRHIINQIHAKQGSGKVHPNITKYTYIKTNELIKIIMKSPRFPIMDAILDLYSQDVVRHCERLINEAFKKRK